MYDNYLQTQEIVEKELMLTNLAKRGTANVKFQDEEDDSPVIIQYSSCFLLQKCQVSYSNKSSRSLFL